MKATEVTAGLVESNGSLLLGLWRDSLHVTCGWLPVHRDQLRAQRSVTSTGKLFLPSLCDLTCSFCSAVGGVLCLVDSLCWLPLLTCTVCELRCVCLCVQMCFPDVFQTHLAPTAAAAYPAAAIPTHNVSYYPNVRPRYCPILAVFLIVIICCPRCIDCDVPSCLVVSLWF